MKVSKGPGIRGHSLRQLVHAASNPPCSAPVVSLLLFDIRHTLGEAAASRSERRPLSELHQGPHIVITDSTPPPHPNHQTPTRSQNEKSTQKAWILVHPARLRGVHLAQVDLPREVGHRGASVASEIQKHTQLFKT